ncbi:MAG TPA: WHG domain-containing protein [Kofleriaceae bacterium]|jgi:AcrR family transcriptional regulator
MAGAKRKPYHHGDLFGALLAAAERLLRHGGIAELGMRAVAREVGVSHTAAQHHFGDMAGLLAELAAVGYRRLASALEATRDLAASERARRVALAKAYVDFARQNPALFALMFRHEMLDMRRPSLAQASGTALRALAGSLVGSAETVGELSRPSALRITAGWGFVHGLATLLVDKRLRGVLKATPMFDDPDDLVDAVLDATTLTQP